MIIPANGGDEKMGDIDYIVSPISIPLSPSTLKVHIKRGAYLCRVIDVMPLLFDRESVQEFIAPLLSMMELGCSRNILIPVSDERRVVVDAMFYWQLFGGIALPVIGDVETTLKSVDEVVTTMIDEGAGGVDITSLSVYFNDERMKRGLL